MNWLSFISQRQKRQHFLVFVFCCLSDFCTYLICRYLPSCLRDSLFAKCICVRCHAIKYLCESCHDQCWRSFVNKVTRRWPEICSVFINFGECQITVPINFTLITHFTYNRTCAQITSSKYQFFQVFQNKYPQKQSGYTLSKLPPFYLRKR